MRLLRNSAAIAVGLAAALLAGTAWADTTYTLSLSSYAGDSIGSVSTDSGSTWENNVVVGPVTMNVSGGTSALTQQVWCTDVATGFNTGSYSLTSIAAPSNGTSAFAAQLQTEYGYSSSDAATRVNDIMALLAYTAPTSPYPTGVTGAAIQAALWELEAEPNSTYGVSSPNFEVKLNSNNSSFVTLANQYLANVTHTIVGGITASANWTYNSGNSQDTLEYYEPSPTGSNQSFGYIVVTTNTGSKTVPEPSAASVISIALAGLVLARLGWKSARK